MKLLEFFDGPKAVSIVTPPLPEAVQGKEKMGQIIPRLGHIGVNFEGFFMAPYGFFMMAESNQRKRQIEMRLRIIGIGQ